MIYTAENTVKLGKLATVYVDGKEIDEVVMVDTDKSIVEYAPRPIRTNAAGDTVLTKKISGKIHIEWSEAK